MAYTWKDAPKGKPSFENRTEEFKQVLLNIKDLAKRIGFKNFSSIFHKAYEALCDNLYGEDPVLPINLSEEFRGIYLSVMMANVFGAMESWNDSPPYYAHEEGLDKEYNELSDQLLEQLRYNLMYVVNEC